MKIFKHGNFTNGSTCFICGGTQDGPVTLIGVVGTQVGYNMEAKQAHVDCLELLYYPDMEVIAMKLKEKKE